MSNRTKGQTLIIALLVAIVLMMIGFVFVTLIGRHFVATQKFGETIDTAYYSEAGVNYAVRQLVYSEDGADWRPVPDNLAVTQLAKDPDYQFLKPWDAADGSGGYTRVNFNEGRALIRVTYNPQIKTSKNSVTTPNALSRYIKIESIGLIGRIDPNDPTTMNDPTIIHNSALAQHKKLVAYVQIGITDYSHWITNLNRNTNPAEFGLPTDSGIWYTSPNNNTTKVDLTKYMGWPEGGGFRVNGNVKLYGNLAFNLNRENGDLFLCSGSVTGDQTSTQEVWQSGAASALWNTATALNSYNGLVRDGEDHLNMDLFSRAVTRLEPPLLDLIEPNTDSIRFLSLTRESGVSYVMNGINVQTGYYGFGRGVFVSNYLDDQEDSLSLFGGYSKRADWLYSTNNAQSQQLTGGYWNGPYYEPPGAYLIFFEDKNAPLDKQQGFTIIRSSRNRRDVWSGLNGETQKSLTFWFRMPDANDNRYYNQYTESLVSEELGNLPFNGVLYFAGNVRVRGRIPAGRQFTVVSNANIYIEGNLVKGSPTSACALLAQDSVVLNTTQFFQPGYENTPQWVKENPSDATEIPHAKITSDPMSALMYRFSFGPLLGGADDQYIFLSHAGTGLGSYVNMQINQGVGIDPVTDPSLYLFPTSRNLQYYYPNQVFCPTLALDKPENLFPSYQRAVLPLPGNPAWASYQLNTEWGIDNLLTFKLDSMISSPSGKQPYFVSKMAISPSDITVEALIYAQNGSFFVLPGPWFNENPQDTKDFVLNAPGVSGNTTLAALYRYRNFGVRALDDTGQWIGPDYPYYGEPLPIRITIRGAISENLPPAMSDQTEWIKRWGWIPARFGLSPMSLPNQFFQYGPENNTAASIVPNIIYEYDPVFSTARTYDGVSQIIRTDEFGRILPPVPKLPVCPNVVYIGEEL